jgi:CheY-like chemotaxis protein
MLALVGQHIKTMGYRVLEASDGEQAWSLAQEHLPDLVILDVMMPGMSGWEVCRKIREDVALAHTAIIMLTGIGENLNELTSPLYGADSYIDKPFKFPELDEKVRGALTKRRGSRPGLARTEPQDGADVANGNGNHTLLSSSESSSSAPPTADVDDSWGDDVPSEGSNGHDESIVLVQTGIGRSAKAKPSPPKAKKPAKTKKAGAKPKAKPKKASVKAKPKPKPKPKKASKKPAPKSKAKPKKASKKPASKQRGKKKR